MKAAVYKWHSCQRQAQRVHYYWRRASLGTVSQGRLWKNFVFQVCSFCSVISMKYSRAEPQWRPGIHSVLVTYFFIYAKHHDMTMFCSRNLNLYAESPLQVPKNIKDPIWLAAFHQGTGVDKELEPNPHCGL